jgi:site-specific recombinase XerD
VIEERRVFVKLDGAGRGRTLSGNTVSAVVVRALARARVQSSLAGGHVLRHTVASRLVRRGASLKEVADFLGHRSLDTTAISAKLDREALRKTMLPWPAEVAR